MTQIGHLVLLPGRQKSKGRPQASTKSQFNSKLGKRKVHAYPALKSLFVQRCSDLMHFIVISIKSALQDHWRTLMGHRPLSPSQPCSLLLSSPFACIYNLPFPKPCVLPWAGTWPGSSCPSTVMGELWWAIKPWLQPDNRRCDLIAFWGPCWGQIKHKFVLDQAEYGCQGMRQGVPVWCTIGKLCEILGLLRGVCHNGIAWNAAVSFSSPDSCSFILYTVWF